MNVHGRDATTWCKVLTSSLCPRGGHKKWSGRRDLNPRPFAPQANALPVCATPRKGFLSGGGKGSRTPDLLNAIQALYQLSYTPSSGSRRLLRVKSSGNLPSLTPPVNHLFSGASELVSARVSGWAGAICRLPAVVDCRRVPGTLLWKRASTGRVSATWADWWWNGRGWRHRALCAARRSCRVAADRDGSPYPAVRCTVSLCCHGGRCGSVRAQRI